MSDRVFISTLGRGLARAACTGGGAAVVEILLEDTAVTCLAADPLQAGRVYAGTQGRGVLRSDDAGSSWRPLGPLGPTGQLDSRAGRYDGQGDRRQPAGKRMSSMREPNPRRLFKSEDGGASWHELLAFQRIRGRRFWFSPAERPFTAYVQAIALSPGDPARIVVGIEFGATVVSDDGGQELEQSPARVAARLPRPALSRGRRQLGIRGGRYGRRCGVQPRRRPHLDAGTGGA